MTALSSPRLFVPLGTALLLAAAALLLQPRDTPRPDTAASREASPSTVMKAGAFNPPRRAPDFSLPGSDGSEVTLARYRGKVVLLTFGFTSCAAVCPTTLSTLAQARTGLGKAGDAVQVVFVTVDPERDGPGHLREYLAAFDPMFIGATGTPQALAAVRDDYGVTAVRQGTGADYAMAHTSSIFLIDPAGRLRAMMPFGREPSDFTHDIRMLLAEGGSE